MKLTRTLLPVAAVLLLQPAIAAAQAIQMLGLFEQRRGTCHTKPAADSRAPDRNSLRQRTPEAVLDALTTGSMKVNAEGLTERQMRMLAEYITERPLGSVLAGEASKMPNRCAAKPLGDPLAGPAWNGWGADGANTRFQPAAAAGLRAEQVPNLKVKWAFGFPNGSSAYGQPTIAGGRVYVGSDNGFVYALDAATGCVYWSFESSGGVRTSISVGKAGAKHAAYFGDVKANVYAVDLETGALLWKKNAESHPLARVTGAPALHDGWLYVPVASFEEGSGPNPKYECCTFRGAVVAYDAASGEQVWKTYTIPELPRPTSKNSIGTQLYGPAGAAVWSAPTIDPKRNAVYVATGDAYTAPAAETSDAVMAFDLRSGIPLWTHQFTPNDAFLVGCAPGRDNCPSVIGPDFDMVFMNSGYAYLGFGAPGNVLLAFGVEPAAREGQHAICISSALERPAHANGDRVPGMRVGPSDVLQVRREHVHMPERAGHAGAHVEAVVADQAVELEEELFGREVGRRKPAVRALPGEQRTGGQPSRQQVRRLDRDVAAIDRPAEDLFHKRVGVAARH